MGNKILALVFTYLTVFSSLFALLIGMKSTSVSKTIICISIASTFAVLSKLFSLKVIADNTSKMKTVK